MKSVAYACPPPGCYVTVPTLLAEQAVVLPDHVDDQPPAAIMLKGMTAGYLLHRTHRVRAATPCSCAPPRAASGSSCAAKSATVSRAVLFHYTAERPVLAEMAGRVFNALREGALRVDLRHGYPLAAAAGAHRDLEGLAAGGGGEESPTGRLDGFLDQQEHDRLVIDEENGFLLDGHGPPGILACRNARGSLTTCNPLARLSDERRSGRFHGD